MSKEKQSEEKPAADKPVVASTSSNQAESRASGGEGGLGGDKV